MADVDRALRVPAVEVGHGERDMLGLVLDHPPLEHVHRPDEVGDEARARILVDLGRLADLHDLAGVHHPDAGGERHRLLLVVGDDDEGDPEPLLDVDELELRLLAQLLVERPERLVEQEQLRLLDQAPRQRHPLPLPARELVRLAVGELRELHQLQHLGDLRRRLVAPHPVAQQPVGDVLLDRHVREQRVGLEHHVGRPLVGRQPGHVLPVDLDAPEGRRLEAREHPEQRRLAAARAAEQAEQLALPDVEADVVDGDEVAELLGDLLDAHERRVPRPRSTA